jgi:ATP-dependent DNA ligase
MVDALACLKGVRSLVIDGELVACDGEGVPNFYRLHFRRHDSGLCVWAFDLLHLTQLSGLAGYAMGNPLKYHESR